MTKEYIKDELKVFVVPCSILDFPDLTIYEKMVYVVLRSFANPREAMAFPKYATIAALGSMSKRQAMRAVQGLVEKGLLRKQMNFVPTESRKMRQTSNIYYLENPENRMGDQQSPHPVTDSHPPRDQQSPHPVTDSHPPRDQQSLQEQKQKNRTKKNKTIEQQQEKVVVVPESIRSFFSERNIPVSEQIISDWLGIASEETILQAANEAINKRKKIDSIVAYIGGMLKKGYTPSVQVNGVMEDKLPEAVLLQQELEKAEKETAAASEAISIEDDPELKSMLEQLRRSKG